MTTADEIRAKNVEFWSKHPEWIDISPLIEAFRIRFFKIVARYDAGGWPTRDAAAPEEEC